MSETINIIKTSHTKIPLLLFVFPLLLGIVIVLYLICYLAEEYLFYSLINFLVTATRVSFFVTGIYLGFLYYKEKNIYYALAAAAFVIRSFMPFWWGGFYWGQQLVWLACGMFLAMPACKDVEYKKIGTYAVLCATMYFVFFGIAKLFTNNYSDYYSSAVSWAAFSLIAYVAFTLELLFLVALLTVYSKNIGNIQELYTAASAGMSTAKEQFSNLTQSVSDLGTRSPDAGSSITLEPEPIVASGGEESGPIGVGVSGAPGGRQYKTVAGPVGLAISNKDSYSVGVNQYAAIIDREAVGGWQLDSIYKIPVTKSAGCLGSLLGKQDETVSFNMLIFYKDE